MSTQREKLDAHVGDWLEARSIAGGPPHRGQISEVIGPSGHRRFRVRWDEKHESIVYPADGVGVLKRQRSAVRPPNGNTPKR